jgi:hypothetical protein
MLVDCTMPYTARMEAPLIGPALQEPYPFTATAKPSLNGRMVVKNSFIA